jgi:hypothetical protein
LTSPERTAVLREIADKYQADHPNVTIEIISPPLENADSKITQMLMNGSGADIGLEHAGIRRQSGGVRERAGTVRRGPLCHRGELG